MTKLKCIMHCFLLSLGIVTLSNASVDTKFDCYFNFDASSYHNNKDAHMKDINCKVALFHSRRSFHFDNRMLYTTENTMCSLDAYKTSLPGEVKMSPNRYIVAVKRGNCSFLEKNEIATLIGHAAIIIVNPVGMGDIFPFGEQVDKSSEYIPAVMVDYTFMDHIYSENIINSNVLPLLRYGLFSFFCMLPF